MKILKEVASAMKYLHSLNVIHRDLKLAIVLVKSNEETRVMDFGLSKLAEGNDTNSLVGTLVTWRGLKLILDWLKCFRNAGKFARARDKISCRRG